MNQKNYKIGKFYEGLGKYIGDLTVYPWNEDYALKVQRFAEEQPEDGRKCPKINEVVIEKIKRSDR